MATVCICGDDFGTVSKLFTHANRFMCCGRFFATKRTMSDHQEGRSHARGHVSSENQTLRANLDCTLCNKRGFTAPDLKQHLRDKHGTGISCPICPRKWFGNCSGLAQHIRSLHHPCPQCLQVFKSSRILFGHQKTSNHLFCLEHDVDFPSIAALHKHQREDAHFGSFECTTCGREFKTEIAMNDHLNSEGHALVAAAVLRQEAEAKNAVTTVVQREELGLFCEAHGRRFKTWTALRQHKQSVQHNPLSELKCSLSDSCEHIFTCPSALLLHFESGKCKSGMSREKLNALVFKHDTNRYITVAKFSGQVAAVGGKQITGKDVLDRLGAPSYRLSMGTMDTDGAELTPAGSYTSSITSDNETMEGDTLSLANTGGAMLTLDDNPAGGTSTESESYNGSSVNAPGTEYVTRTIAAGGNRDNICVTDIDHSYTMVNLSEDINSVSLSSCHSGVILTPSASFTGSDAGVALSTFSNNRHYTAQEWAFLNASTNLTPATTSDIPALIPSSAGVWPCTICACTFRREHDLVQHLRSVAHAPEIFHCPTALLGLSGGRKAMQVFKTLSGLAQHLEAGACKGGKGVLGMIVGVLEKEIEKAGGGKLKLLKGEA